MPQALFDNQPRVWSETLCLCVLLFWLARNKPTSRAAWTQRESLPISAVSFSRRSVRLCWTVPSSDQLAIQIRRFSLFTTRHHLHPSTQTSSQDIEETGLDVVAIPPVHPTCISGRWSLTFADLPNYRVNVPRRPHFTACIFPCLNGKPQSHTSKSHKATVRSGNNFRPITSTFSAHHVSL